MIARAEESEADVRREDQERINRFARLNARKGENAAERAQIQVRWIKPETNGTVYCSTTALHTHDGSLESVERIGRTR
jgi:hypothetical protein